MIVEGTGTGKLGDAVYLNVHQPFTMVAVGEQGSGKSYTTNVVLENCLLPSPLTTPTNGDGHIFRLSQPMAALVLHYDQSESNVCEATGLVKLAKRPRNNHGTRGDAAGGDPLGAREEKERHQPQEVPLTLRALKKVIVLVSPSFYEQRKKFYTSKAGSRYEVSGNYLLHRGTSFAPARFVAPVPVSLLCRCTLSCSGGAGWMQCS